MSKSPVSDKPTVVKITKAIKTCDACPAQWDAETDDGRKVYVRYRWGYLSVRVAAPGDKEEFAGVRGEEIFGQGLGESQWDGELSYLELKQATNGFIEWPESDEAKP